MEVRKMGTENEGLRLRYKSLSKKMIQEFDEQRVVLTDGKNYAIRELIKDGKPTGLLEVLGYVDPENSDDETVYVLPFGIEPYSTSTKPGDNAVDDLVLKTRLKTESSYYK